MRNSYNKILHISSGVSVQKLYSNIFKRISKNDLKQFVYVPCNSASKLNENEEQIEKVEFSYFVVDSFLSRLLFWPKVKKHFDNLIKQVNPRSLNYSFAYTVMTDGAISYLLYKNYKIPYSVFVRNTDINFFYKYFIFLRPLFLKILTHAAHINFPNPSYRDKVLKMIPRNELPVVQNKIHITPNGVDDFWHRNRLSQYRIGLINENQLSLLFVGKIEKNKNLLTILRTVKELNKERTTKLTIIGGFRNPDESYSRKVLEAIEEMDVQVDYKGVIKNKDLLLECYRNADIFVMPSFSETFGLVFVEAMTQGLPIIYSKGEGIDGYFKDGHVGFSIKNLKSTSEISKRVKEIANNYACFSDRALIGSKQFNWDLIITKYLNQIG